MENLCKPFGRPPPVNSGKAVSNAFCRGSITTGATEFSVSLISLVQNGPLRLFCNTIPERHREDYLPQPNKKMKYVIVPFASEQNHGVGMWKSTCSLHSNSQSACRRGFDLRTSEGTFAQVTYDVRNGLVLEALPRNTESTWDKTKGLFAIALKSRTFSSFCLSHTRTACVFRKLEVID